MTTETVCSFDRVPGHLHHVTSVGSSIKLNKFFCFSVPAVYNACGLASYDLFDDVDFDQWFTNQLVNELNNSSSRYVHVSCITLEALISEHPQDAKKVSITGAGRLRQWFS